MKPAKQDQINRKVKAAVQVILPQIIETWKAQENKAEA